MSKRVLVTLVGGRPVPNILAALHLRPAVLYFIVSKDSMALGGNYLKLKDALPVKFKSSAESLTQTVNPYDLDETTKACFKIISKHENEEIIFCSASEPKSMAFGAYDAVKQFRSQSQTNCKLCYTGRGQLIWIFPKLKPENMKVSIQEYLTSYGWNKPEMKTECSIAPGIDEENIRSAANLLAFDLNSRSLLRIMRQHKYGGSRLEQPLTADEYDLLLKLQQLHLLRKVQKDERGNISYVVDYNPWEFFKGKWLEIYVFETARALTLFDECAWNIKGNELNHELDFIGIFGGQLLVASCKSGEKPKIKDLEELADRAEWLGKGMCTKIFVTTFPSEEFTKGYLKKFKAFATERQIVIVLGEKIKFINKILQKQVKKPCYPRI